MSGRPQGNSRGRGVGRGRGGSGNPSRGGGSGASPSGSRGRGNFTPQGGRGGFAGGGRGGRPGPEPAGVYMDGGFSPPRADIKKAEDDFIKKTTSLTGAMKNTTMINTLPLRPGHGTAGAPITVFANYFEMKVSDTLNLHRYAIDIRELVKKDDGFVPSKNALQLSRKKRKRLFEILLEDEVYSSAMTDFSSFLVSCQPLAGIGNSFAVHNVAYKKEGEDTPAANATHYELKIQYTYSLPLSSMLEYLKSTTQTVTLANREETLQALNVVVNQAAQTNPFITTVGQNKFFSLNSDANNLFDLGAGLQALRGVFKSVRPATARLLLNVNVSHTVCYSPVPLTNLVAEFRRKTTSLPALSKMLKFVQVERTHLPPRSNAAGLKPPGVKTIWGLASPTDGATLPKPPRVKHHGAGPANVSFWLETTSPSSKMEKATKKDGKAPIAPLNGRYCSVLDFFRNNYEGVSLNPDNPVVNVGNSANPTYLPLEVCRVVSGQSVGRKLDADQTRNMITFACRAPKANAQFIASDARRLLGLDDPRSKRLSECKIVVGKDLITVPARILGPPVLMYHQAVTDTQKQIPAAPSHKEVVTDGGWNMNKISFVKRGKVGLHACIYLNASNRLAWDRRPTIEHVKETMEELRNFVTSQGVAFEGDPLYTHEHKMIGVNKEELLETIFKTAITQENEISGKNDKKLHFLFFVLPNTDAAIYKMIKTLGDVKYGINTICMVEQKLLKRQRSYFANVGLKINLKAGGINTVVSPPTKLGIINEGQTMVIGFDVTHPQPGATKSAPSVAGMVASIDKQLAQWPAIIRTQKARAEITPDLEAMFRSRLEMWRKNNPELPNNIIVYRDGVSEGQYSLVLDQEVPALRAAAKKIYPADKQKLNLPRITVIVVGKRHHTRFYPTSMSTASQNGNTKPGTVVDRGVVEVRNWDFYLQAHSCLQGTARPAHYYVILDEVFRPLMATGKIKNAAYKSAADAIEDLTHNMCYLFGRATKAVSICPPAYYADLLCERARAYLVNFYEPGSPSQGTPAGSVAGDADPVLNEAMYKVHDALKDTMFYI